MPNYYAHLKFGAQVIRDLPGDLARVLEEEREAFDLGCLGPDPLFFYQVIRPNALRREGLRMHGRSAMPAARRLRQAIEEQVPMARGYGAGFLCHLALDSACHGYVYQKAAEGPVSHGALEGEYDRLLMQADGVDAMAGGHHLPRVSLPQVWQAAARAYEHASPRKVKQAYRSMGRYTGILTSAYGRPTGKVLDAVSLIPPCRSAKGISLQRKPDPNSLESSAVMGRLMSRAVEETARQVTAFFDAIDRRAPIPDWFDRDFKGNPPAPALEQLRLQGAHS